MFDRFMKKISPKKPEFTNYLSFYELGRQMCFLCGGVKEDVALYYQCNTVIKAKYGHAWVVCWREFERGWAEERDEVLRGKETSNFE